MDNFAYMSGTGNDFIVGKYEGEVSEIQIIALVSDAEYEVDGVIFVEPLDNKSVKMHYYNNDGSDAELCVNGVRCVAKYALDNKYLDVDRFTVNAPVGDLEVYVDDNIVEVSTPIPTYEEEKINVNTYEGVKSSVGNPHFMIEVDDVDGLDLEKLNSEVANEKLFPDGVNVEIYQIVNRNYIKARVFERGVGETDACGSGALCMFNYLNKTNQIDNNSYVMYPGGVLNIRFENDNLYLSGEVIYL
jgi:diaminopimelate epimerase